MGYTPHVLVVGGGLLGTAITRDLAIRGLEVTLVERGTLAAGATGTSPGLLRAGTHGVEDRTLARRMLRETRTLREIAAHCIEHTGNLLVSPGDDPAYDDLLSETKVRAIPNEELEGEALAGMEPGLAADVDRAISVPEAVVDPFELTLATARSAADYGATIRTHTEVVGIETEGGTVGPVTLRHDPSPAGPWDRAPEELRADGGDSGKPTLGPAHTPGGMDTSPSMPGLTGRFEGAGDVETEEVDPDYVVNAAGSWTGEVAALAGLEVDLSFRTETAVTVYESPVRNVVTRLDRPDGTAIVPRGDLAVVGGPTTETRGPGEASVSPETVGDVRERLRDAVPGIDRARVVRADCAVHAHHPDAQTRLDHASVDHGSEDGCWGMTTVVGGTLTTHRYVAERVVDEVCAKFGIRRECRTDGMALPGSEVDDREESDRSVSAPISCACQSVTRPEVRQALDETDVAVDLDEVRIRTGATMGHCQGGRCAHGVAAELYPEYDEETTERSRRALLGGRWQGQRHTLGEGQLERAARTYLQHAGTMDPAAGERELVPDRAADDSDEEDRDGSDEEDRDDSDEEDRDDSDRIPLDAFDDGRRPEKREPPPWGERPS